MAIEQYRPVPLLWWFSKDDRPPGLVAHLREQYPWCKTATHTQDDPWDLRRHPEYSREFEFAVTCCRESVAECASHGIKAIVLYPPPAISLHGVTQPTPGEDSDFSLTILPNYAREGGGGRGILAVARTRRPHHSPDSLPTTTAVAVRSGGGVARSGADTHLRRTGAPYFRGHSAFGIPWFPYLCRIVGSLRSGGFMLTDHVEGIEEIFEIWTEIDTWTTREELVDKAR